MIFHMISSVKKINDFIIIIYFTVLWLSYSLRKIIIRTAYGLNYAVRLHKAVTSVGKVMQ